MVVIKTADLSCATQAVIFDTSRLIKSTCKIFRILPVFGLDVSIALKYIFFLRNSGISDEMYGRVAILRPFQKYFNFTSFSTVFQSYQDDERVTMKGCERRLISSRLKRGSNPGPLDQQAKA